MYLSHYNPADFRLDFVHVAPCLMFVLLLERKNKVTTLSMANAGPPVGEVRHIAKLNLLNWGSWRYGISILLERNNLFRVTLRQELRLAEVIIFVC